MSLLGAGGGHARSAVPSPRTRQTDRAIISASSVRMTRTVIRLSLVEIISAVFALPVASSSRPRNPSPSQMRAQTGGAFSPMPPANTSVSSPPQVRPRGSRYTFPPDNKTAPPLRPPGCHRLHARAILTGQNSSSKHRANPTRDSPCGEIASPSLVRYAKDTRQVQGPNRPNEYSSANRLSA